MCSCKPLESGELLNAIRLDPYNDTFRLAEEIDEDLLLDLCNNLLIIDSQRKVWRFSHLSVTEYFEENHWDLRQAHCHVAKGCLLLLIETYKKSRLESASEIPNNDLAGNSYADSQKEPHDIFHLEHTLQIYVRHHWIVHVQAEEGQEVDSILSRLLKIFLGSPEESSVQYRGWYHQVVSDGWRTRPQTSIFTNITVEEIAPERTSLFTMCRFSLYILLLDWWVGMEINLSHTNSRGDSLLVLAAAAGSKLICEALIKQGILVNMQLEGRGYGSALAAAACYGETEIVKFLVQEGKANVNMLLQSGIWGSALAAAAAAFWGKIENVKFLVQEGKADVNMLLQSGIYGSALAAAALGGNIEIVKFLVNEGKADVNMVLQSGNYGSALSAAAAGASWKQAEIVKFLVQEGGVDVKREKVEVAELLQYQEAVGEK